MDRISLEQARKRAKELVRAGKAPKLADAQRVIARELGFPSWPALVESQRALAERFVLAATSGRREDADELLAQLGDRDAYVDLVLGVVRNAVGKGGPRDWEPLLYVAHSVYPERVAAGRVLLQRGADPGPALYPAAGIVHDPALTELLLEAGADPNDGESLYHATETPDTACIRLLLAHGARPSPQDLLHALDYRDDVELIRLLLDHGADASYVSPHHRGQLWVGATALHQAVLRGRSPEILRLLAERGGQLDARDGAGRTPYALAVATGRDDLASVLADLGAEATSDAHDAFLAACLRGDIATARALGVEPRARDAEALIEAVHLGRAPAVRAMLELGFPVDVRGELGGTPLHFAAWHGRPELVDLLLAHGADAAAVAEVPDEDGTPLRWATDARRFGPPGDHAAVIERLGR